MTAQLEREIAAACGREAAAFVVSCTMANQLALGALCGPTPAAVLADASAHVVNFEAGGLAHLSGATVQAVAPANGLYLTLDGDIARHARVDSDSAAGRLGWEVCPTRVVSIEDTAHGTVVPLRELRELRAWATRHGVKVHVDGARVWDAVVAGTGSGGSLADIAACADALTVSFAKGIGAPIGAAIVGPVDVICRVKRLRQSIGGGVRKFGVLAAAAREAMLENFGPGPLDARGVLRAAHGMAAAVARMWTSRGGKLLRPAETNMVWLDLAAAGVAAAAVNEAALRRGVLVSTPRIVLHHQICAKALASLEQVFEDVLVERNIEVMMPAGGAPLMSKGCVLAL